MNWIEILGYAASLLIAVALSMNSIARLRALNLAGALAFALYGYLVGAYPILIVNAYIAVINVVFLLKMQPGRSEAFELLAINRMENNYLQRFLKFHKDDIHKYFPHFYSDGLDNSKVVLILRDMLPVGVVICENTGKGALNIHLDYVIPSHRDFRCAEYFYESWNKVISCEGVTHFVTSGDEVNHQKYLRKMGFRRDESLGKGLFVRPA